MVFRRKGNQMNIGSKVIAWNPGTDRKATGTLVAMDGNYFKVEWTRTVGFQPQTYIGTFVHAEAVA
jgi:hypothetical protein